MSQLCRFVVVFCRISTVVMVIVVNIKSLHMSSTPIVYIVFATVVIIAVVLVGVVVFCPWQLYRFVAVLCCPRGRICHRCAVANVVIVAIFVLSAVVYGVFIVVLVVICVNFTVSCSFFAVSVPLLWS